MDGQPAGSFSVTSHGSGPFPPFFRSQQHHRRPTGVPHCMAAFVFHQRRSRERCNAAECCARSGRHGPLGIRRRPERYQRPGTKSVAESRAGRVQWCLLLGSKPRLFPVVQFSVSNAIAGTPMRLDATASFAYDGTDLVTDFTWQQLSGPTRVIFSNRNAQYQRVRTCGWYIFFSAFASKFRRTKCFRYRYCDRSEYRYSRPADSSFQPARRDGICHIPACRCAR